jgi:hypothetical protein
MTMHLMHPSFSTGGKSKAKPKFKSAEAKRAAEALAAEWKSIKAKHETKPMAKKVFKQWSYELSAPPGRSTSHHIPSRGDSTGVASAREVMQYTGTEMIGIGQLHKSNAVPVFKAQEAKDLASMRR